MFALISSRSGSQSAMMLRWALQGHHGPLVHLDAKNEDKVKKILKTSLDLP